MRQDDSTEQLPDKTRSNAMERWDKWSSDDIQTTNDVQVTAYSNTQRKLQMNISGL